MRDIEKAIKSKQESINNVLIVSGEKNKEKTVLIKHISKDNVLKKIKESLNGL